MKTLGLLVSFLILVSCGDYKVDKSSNTTQAEPSNAIIGAIKTETRFLTRQELITADELCRDLVYVRDGSTSLYDKYRFNVQLKRTNCDDLSNTENFVKVVEPNGYGGAYYKIDSGESQHYEREILSDRSDHMHVFCSAIIERNFNIDLLPENPQILSDHVEVNSLSGFFYSLSTDKLCDESGKYNCIEVAYGTRKKAGESYSIGSYYKYKVFKTSDTPRKGLVYSWMESLVCPEKSKRKDAVTISTVNSIQF